MQSNSFADYCAHHRDAIEAALDRYTADLDERCPEVLKEAMRYSLLQGGKRIRPLLVLMSAEACGGEPQTALPAACAVEMIHTFSLIHDDLPAMDDDDLRRGQPTNHKVFGEAQAILAGDALLALAFSVLRDLEFDAVTAACCSFLANATGALGMTGGQSQDMSGAGTTMDLADIEFLHERKTGALIEASLTMGALVAQAPDRERQLLQGYGQKLGLVFQITDDILDAEGDSEQTGKAVQKDADKGKQTYTTLLGVEESRAKAQALADDAVALIEDFGEKGEWLRVLVGEVLTREK